MNADTFEGNWKILKGEVQQQWGKLTNDVLDQVAGSRTKLSGQLQKSYGLAKDAADQQIAAWEKTRRRNTAA